MYANTVLHLLIRRTRKAREEMKKWLHEYQFAEHTASLTCHFAFLSRQKLSGGLFWPTETCSIPASCLKSEDGD